MSARARALLLLLVLIGFGLRVFLLDGQSLWYDEGVTATVAQRDLVELETPRPGGRRRGVGGSVLITPAPPDPQRIAVA